MATQEQRLAAYAATAKARTGGTRDQRPNRFERLENIRTSQISSSAMPLDTEAHWSWRNPLIILPLLMLLLFVIAIVGTIVTLL